MPLSPSLNFDSLHFCSPRSDIEARLGTLQRQHQHLTARSGAFARGRFKTGRLRVSPPNSAEAPSTRWVRERRHSARLTAFVA